MAKWSFKNPVRIYGTMLFEGIYQKKKFPNLIQRAIDTIDLDFSKIYELYVEVENVIEGFSK